MNLITSGENLINIIREQYHLASKANIGILESNLMADFERNAFLSLVLREAEKLAEDS